MTNTERNPEGKRNINSGETFELEHTGFSDRLVAKLWSHPDKTSQSSDYTHRTAIAGVGGRRAFCFAAAFSALAFALCLAVMRDTAPKTEPQHRSGGTQDGHNPGMPNEMTAFASTSFRYIVERDDFSGSDVDFVRAENQIQQSLYIGKPDKRIPSFDGNVTFIMDPGAFICANSGDWLLVDYVSVNAGVPTYQSQFRWYVSQNKNQLTIERGEIADNPLKAMTTAQEVRFRYQDDCGEVETVIFSTDGLAHALSQLKAST